MKELEQLQAENKALHRTINAFDAMIGFSCFSCNCEPILQLKTLLQEYREKYPAEVKDEYHVSPRQLNLFHEQY